MRLTRAKAGSVESFVELNGRDLSDRGERGVPGSSRSPKLRDRARDTRKQTQFCPLLPAKQVSSSERVGVKEIFTDELAQQNVWTQVQTFGLSCLLDGGRAVSRSLNGAAMLLCQVVRRAQAIGNARFPASHRAVDMSTRKYSAAAVGRKGTGRNVMGYPIVIHAAGYLPFSSRLLVLGRRVSFSSFCEIRNGSLGNDTGAPDFDAAGAVVEKATLDPQLVAVCRTVRLLFPNTNSTTSELWTISET
ncbi:hypothetical protein EDB87DRAFT_1576775 [Lactarius vividus]|nr:hypothetical protein EDB87DRAFT_1576775 [Lactarius vividus]